MGCSFESRTRSRSPISARIAVLWSELRLAAFRMKSTPQVGARYPALVQLGPAPRSDRQFWIEDRPPSRPGRPQARGRLWIARTQEPSPPDAGNTIYRSLLLPRSFPSQRQRHYAEVGDSFRAESTKVNFKGRDSIGLTPMGLLRTQGTAI